MKRDTNNRPGVSKSAHTAPIGDPKSTSPQRQHASGVTTSFTNAVSLSPQYIDSRLKQFCCR